MSYVEYKIKRPLLLSVQLKHLEVFCLGHEVGVDAMIRGKAKRHQRQLFDLGECNFELLLEMWGATQGVQIQAELAKVGHQLNGFDETIRKVFGLESSLTGTD